MQLAIFYITENDSEALDRCNQFLRSHRIVSIQEHFNPGTPGRWTVLVKHVSGAPASAGNQERKDYREVLSESDFAQFARLRSIRKQMAEEFMLPAYVIFTNEELAQMAQLGVLSLDALRNVRGIGEKKLEKFGQRFMELYSHDPDAKGG